MIVYENENARLLVEGGSTNIAPMIKNSQNTKIYITEKAALKLHNSYYNKTLEDINLIINSKPIAVIPVVRMKMI